MAVQLVLTLHVLLVFIWTGNLLALTRLMGYHVKEDEQTQMRLARIYRRMYNFIGLPSMILAVGLGAVLFTKLDPDQGTGWFIFKIVFVMGLIVCDVICGQYVAALNHKPDTSRGVPYKIVHGIAGLLLIGVLVSLYILKPGV